MQPYQCSAAEQDHEDDKALKPAVLYYSVAGFSQRPPHFPPAHLHVYLAALEPLHAAWGETKEWWQNPFCTEVALVSVVSVAVILTVKKAGVRFHRFVEFKVHRLPSLAAQRTVYCAALRGAVLVVIFYILYMEVFESFVTWQLHLKIDMPPLKKKM